MTKRELLDRILNNINAFEPEDQEIIRDAIEELAAHGIPNGCFQDYTILMALMQILYDIMDYAGKKE
jgi:hypothetical protein